MSDAARRDKSPPGWEGTTEAMKKHGEIDNPFALAWWMQEQGFHPHDAANKDTLAACNTMYKGSGMHDDGPASATAGNKPGNDNPNEYEQQTEETAAIGEEGAMYDDDDDAVISHGAGHSPAGHHGAAGDDDDEERLLDDSEVASGEELPHVQAAASDPNVTASATHASGVSDPAPDVEGLEAFETHDSDEDEDFDDE